MQADELLFGEDAMDWASIKPGELQLSDLAEESQPERSINREQLHWLLSATGIWEELRFLEEEQGKLQKTLQDVLRRRREDFAISTSRSVSQGMSGGEAMVLAGGFTFLGFVVLNLVLASQAIDLRVLILGGYISVIVAVLVGALFASES
jgi:hypothetical protein